MRAATRIVCMMAVLGVLTVGAGRAQAEDNPLKGKFAYINVDRVFDEYTKGKELTGKFEEKANQVEQERQKRVEEIKKLKEGLDLLSEDARKKRQQDVDQKINELQQFVNSMTIELGRERDETLKTLVEEIDAVVADFSEKNGYLIVFHSRFILWGDPSLDVTEQIVKVLNDQAAAKTPVKK